VSEIWIQRLSGCNLNYSSVEREREREREREGESAARERVLPV
jgi:hypothetical protein